MFFVRRLYVNALFGALGGLLGWMLFGEFVHTGWNWSMQALCGGALIGAAIGYCVVSVDAILDQAWLRLLRYASIGILLGGIGGAFGFWLGELVHYTLLPEGTASSPTDSAGLVVARAVGWMLFGLAVGGAEGVAGRSVRKASYGAIGGALGGFLGGTIFGILMTLWEPSQQSYVWGQALGLMILGACIGALISLVEEVLKPAALRVVRGWQEGREFPLVKSRSVVGREESADILLLRDMGIAKQHFTIERRGEEFILSANGTGQPTTVNGRPVQQSQKLTDGDRLQLGATVLKFVRRNSPAERTKRA